MISVSAAELYSNSLGNVVLFMLGLLVSALADPKIHWLEGCRLRVQRINNVQRRQQPEAHGRTADRALQISQRSGQSRRAERDSIVGSAQVRHGVSARSGQWRTLNPLVGVASQTSTGLTLAATRAGGNNASARPRSERTNI